MRFIVASRSEAQRLLLSTSTGPTIGAVVSIGSPGDAVPGSILSKPHLRLEFDDVPEGTQTFFGVIATPPNKIDIQRLIDHAPSLLANDGKILCHCYAGISRSSAAAYILNSIIKGPGNEDEALEELVTAFPRIHPNEFMIKIASELLDNPNLLEAYLKRFKQYRIWDRYQSILSHRQGDI